MVSGVMMLKGKDCTLTALGGEKSLRFSLPPVRACCSRVAASLRFQQSPANGETTKGGATNEVSPWRKIYKKCVPAETCLCVDLDCVTLIPAAT